MTEKIDDKFKRSYKDEYRALYEAVYGVEQQTDNDDDDEDVDDDCVSKSRRDNEFSYTSDQEDEITNFGTSDEINSSENEKTECTSYNNQVVLPDLVLEKIFDSLSIQDKYYAGQVCRSWHRAFYLSNSWRTFIFDDTMLTRRIFNYYSGWQHMLDHVRVQICLNKIGRFIKTLIFKPVYNFYNLYEFMNMISFYAEQATTAGGGNHQLNRRPIGSNISTLHYTFPCNMSTNNRMRVYGTGGKLLDSLKKLMKNLPSLRNLELVDLMLDAEEALTFLDHLCYTHCLIMERLTVVNISKTQCELLHLGMFLNLQVLVISPQSLGSDVLYLIGESKIRHLHIVQNSYTPADIAAPLSSWWRKCAFANPNLKVHLSVKSKEDVKLLWQPKPSPVSTVLFDSQLIKLNPEIINQVVTLYANTLRNFGNLSLPRYHQSRSFQDRLDTFLLMLCHACPSLETLIIREKISTCTILLIVTTAKNLHSLYVRRMSVLLRADWPKNPEWSDEFYNWLKNAARSYKQTEKEVSNILGYRWTLLSDNEFRRVTPKLY